MRKISHRVSRLGTVALLLGAFIGLAGAPAQANLIFDETIDAGGQGLGAVATIVTRESNLGPPNTGMEGGCVGWDGAANDTSSSSCLFGVPGDGKIVGLNQTQLSGDIDGLTQYGDLALVFNVDEIGTSGETVELDQLYIALYAEDGTVLFMAEWADGPMVFDQNNGVGGSGFVFVLDSDMMDAANLIAFDENIRIGGGFQLVDETGSNGPETVNVAAILNAAPPPPAPPPPAPPPPAPPPPAGPPSPGDIPEPASLLLFGLGLLGMMWMVRRRKTG